MCGPPTEECLYQEAGLGVEPDARVGMKRIDPNQKPTPGLLRFGLEHHVDGDRVCG